MAGTLRVTGELLGRRLGSGGGTAGVVVRVDSEGRPVGPAENAFVFVERDGYEARGRYIAWINLYDIEHAARHEAGAWELVEPPDRFDQQVRWHPYGWGGPSLPSVADSPRGGAKP